MGPTRPDRELVGQGLASIASGLFGGMPATGAIARTAVNVRSGARTRLAAAGHALVILARLHLLDATGALRTGDHLFTSLDAVAHVRRASVHPR